MENENNEDNGCCCCCNRPLIEETEEIKKLKPFLIAGIIVYTIVLFLDLFYIGGSNLFSYALVILFLCLMTFNRCYFAFIFYTIYSILLLFQTIIPGFGVSLQSLFPTDKSIGVFVIYLFMFIFYFVFFYFAFKAYKEMKYVFLNNMSNRPQLSNGFSADFAPSDNNNNYGNSVYDYGNNGNNGNNYNYNNNSAPSSGGFKAFSGKGYTVGGS